MIIYLVRSDIKSFFLSTIFFSVPKWNCIFTPYSAFRWMWTCYFLLLIYSYFAFLFMCGNVSGIQNSLTASRAFHGIHYKFLCLFTLFMMILIFRSEALFFHAASSNVLFYLCLKYIPPISLSLAHEHLQWHDKIFPSKFTMQLDTNMSIKNMWPMEVLPRTPYSKGCNSFYFWGKFDLFRYHHCIS